MPPHVATPYPGHKEEDRVYRMFPVVRPVTIRGSDYGYNPKSGVEHLEGLPILPNKLPNAAALIYDNKLRFDRTIGELVPCIFQLRKVRISNVWHDVVQTEKGYIEFGEYLQIEGLEGSYRITGAYNRQTCAFEWMFMDRQDINAGVFDFYYNILLNDGENVELTPTGRKIV